MSDLLDPPRRVRLGRVGRASDRVRGSWAALADELARRVRLAGRRAWVAVVVVGDQAQVWNGLAYGLDTGACHGGYLTALVVPGFTLHRVKAKHDYWAQARRAYEVPVAQARPWASFSWKKLDRELAELKGRRSAPLRAFASDLEAWLGTVDALIDPIIEQAIAAAADLAAEHEGKSVKKAAAEHPHAALLFAALGGSIDAPRVRSCLPCPEAIVRAASTFRIAEAATVCDPSRPPRGNASRPGGTLSL